MELVVMAQGVLSRHGGDNDLHGVRALLHELDLLPCVKREERGVAFRPEVVAGVRSGDERKVLANLLCDELVEVVSVEMAQHCVCIKLDLIGKE